MLEDWTGTCGHTTDGFGPSASNEGSTHGYELPNAAYAVTFVALIFWAARMLNLDLKWRYGDLLEHAL